FLGAIGAEREDGGHVRPRDVIGVLLGHLLDVDPAHVAEDEHGQLATAVPGDGGEVLLHYGHALLDEHTARLLALDLELEDGGGSLLGGGGFAREFDPARLHATAGQHLRLEHDRPRDLAGGRARLGGGLGDTPLEQRDAMPGEESLGLEFVEPHRRSPERWRASTRSQARSRRRTVGGGASAIGLTAASAPAMAFSACVAARVTSSTGSASPSTSPVVPATASIRATALSRRWSAPCSAASIPERSSLSVARPALWAC